MRGLRRPLQTPARVPAMPTIRASEALDSTPRQTHKMKTRNTPLAAALSSDASRSCTARKSAQLSWSRLALGSLLAVFALTPSAPAAQTNAQAATGIWAIRQVLTDSALTAAESEINNALASPGIKGLSIRVPWNALEDGSGNFDPTVLNHARTIANNAGVDLSIRFMAGRWSPDRLFTSPLNVHHYDKFFSDLGQTMEVPLPFLTTGAPNVAFEQQWEGIVAHLAHWCRANNVRLLHLAWYGEMWAELHHAIDVRNETGYSYNNFLVAHQRLIDIGLKYAGSDLAIELPYSGGGPLIDVIDDLTDYIIGKIGPSNDIMFVQANGWDHLGEWGVPPAEYPATETAKDAGLFPKPALRALQSINPYDFDWNLVFPALYNLHATYGEIYTPSFNNSHPHKADLNSEIAAFAAHVAKGAPVAPGGMQWFKLNYSDNVRLYNASTAGPQFLPYQWTEERDAALSSAKGFFTDNTSGTKNSNAFSGVTPRENGHAVAIKIYDDTTQYLRLKGQPFSWYDSNGQMSGEVSFYVALEAAVQGAVNWSWSQANSMFFGLAVDGINYGSQPSPVGAGFMFLNGTRDFAGFVSGAHISGGATTYQQWGGGTNNNNDFNLNTWMKCVIAYTFDDSGNGSIQLKIDRGTGSGLQNVGSAVTIQSLGAQRDIYFIFHTNGKGRTTSTAHVYLDDVSVFYEPIDLNHESTLVSVAAEDGWVLENAATDTGGSIDATANTTSSLRVGDDASDRQYKSILSFDTSAIPDGATIVSARLEMLRGSLTGTNPFSTHGTCRVDIRNGGFNGSNALQTGDFQAAASASQVATMSNPGSNGTWSTGNLNANGLAQVNKSGRTQLRVYFATDDNNDLGADYVGFYSAEATAANRPRLVVTYRNN